MVAAYTFLALCIAVVAVAVVVVTVKRPGAPASPAAASRAAGTDDSSAVAVVRSGPALLSLQPLQGGAAEKTLTLPGRPAGLVTTADHTKAYLLDSSRAAVIPVDLVHGTIGAPIAAGRLPVDLHLSADGATLYVTDNLGGAVIPIDTASDRAQPAVQLEQGLDLFAPAPTGSLSAVGAFTPSGQPGQLYFYDRQKGLGTPLGVGMSRPEDVAFNSDGSTAWVIEQGLGNAPGVLIPVDVASRTPGAPITLGHAPAGSAVTADHRLLVISNSLDATVSIVDLARGELVATVSVGADPEDVHIDSVGTTAWVACGLDKALVPVDLRTHRAGAPVHMSNAPQSVALPPQPGVAWALFPSSSGSVSFLDRSRHSLGKRLAVGNGPAVIIAADSRTAWVANSLDDSLQSVDIEAQTVGPAIPVARDPEGLVLTPDGQTLLVRSDGDGTHPGALTAIDTTSSAARPVLAVGVAPVALATTPDGKTAFVANHQSNSVSVIDVAAWRLVRTVTLPCSPTSVRNTHDNQRVYVTCNAPAVVIPVMATGDGEGSPISVAQSPRLVAEHRGPLLFVIGSHELQAINVSDGSVVHDKTEPNNIVAARPTPDDRRLLAVDNSGGSLLLIDPNTLSTKRSLSIGSRPGSIDLSADGSRAYVVDDSEQKLYVVDIAGWRVAATIDVSPNVTDVVVPALPE